MIILLSTQKNSLISKFQVNLYTIGFCNFFKLYVIVLPNTNVIELTYYYTVCECQERGCERKLHECQTEVSHCKAKYEAHHALPL